MIDFSNELETFKTELKVTEEELETLQARLNGLPDTSHMKAQLIYLKDPKKRVVPKVVPKVVNVKKVPGEKQTRRKKTEMIAFRSDIKQAIKVVGRRGKVFGYKNVLNTIKSQGHNGDASDAQIIRQMLNKGVKEGWLNTPAKGEYQLA